MNSVTFKSRAGTLFNSLVVLSFFALAAVLPASAQSLALPADAAIVEGNSLSVAVTYTGATTTAIGTVDFQVLGGATCAASQNQATAGDDFVVSSGTLSFPSGTTTGTTKSFTVQTVEDTIRENADQLVTNSECFQVTLSNHTATVFTGGVTDATQILSITDDESNPSLSIADASGAENAGTIGMTITLTGAIDEDLDLGALDSYTDVSTEGAADYTAASGAGTLSAGATSGTLSVAVVDDAVYEGTEVVNVQIAADPRYTVTDGVGKLTIADDEGVPELSINDASSAEGASASFTITKSHAAEAAYNIALSYSDITATSGSDYTPVLSVAVAAGDATTESVAVAAIDDALVESTENYIVSITDGAAYDVDAGNGSGLGTITDNDGIDISVAVTLGDASIDLDGTPATTVTVVLTNNGVETPGTDITMAISDTGFDLGAATFTSYTGTAITCATANIQAGSCVVDNADFTAGASETLVFAISADGAAGTTASVTVSESGNTETDDSNNADSASALLVGLDFGDYSDFASGSHRIQGTLFLGDVGPDAETSDASTLAGTVDDLASTDDEDGLILPSQLLQQDATTTTNYIGVRSSGAGYLTVIARYGVGGVGDGAVVELNDQPVVAGVNWFAIDLNRSYTVTGVFDNVLRSIRLRLCDTVDTCDSAGATLVNGGEIEDFEVSASVTDLGAGALPTTATVTLPLGTVEPVVLSNDNTTITLVDGNGNTIFAQTEATLTGGITITGNASPNTLVVDVANFDGAFDLDYDGGAGADAMELTDSGATVHGTITHTFTNATDGTIVDSGGLFDISYSNLAPILDNLDATNRVMTFGAGDDTIVLSDNGSSVDGMSFIDSNNSEQVTFANPTTSLTINAGAGADTIDFQGVDETAPNNSFTITFNGDAGADTFTILPIPNTSSLGALTVAGGAPATCSGDVLDINTSGGAVIDNLSPTPVTFTAGSHNSIAFSGIEAFADQSADVALSATSTAGTDLNAGDITTITLTVTNSGPDTASCVVVADILLDGAFTITSGPTFSVGSFNSPQWNIGALASGDSATLTYTVTVGQTFNGTASITASSPEGDPNLTNNSVSFGIEPAFPFPTKAQATAAEWFGSGANEHLVVGLANGFSGLSSSVLCRVPPSAGFPENLYRECGDGLPYPLYVNDLFLDDQGTPADSTDDKLYLASWGSAGLYVSEDGGENFTAAEPALGPKGGWANVYAIVEDASGFLYISANNGHVFRSLNNGTTWQQVGSLPGVASDTPWSLSAHGTQAGRLYAGTFGNGVFTSDDFGFTWTKLGGDAVNALLIADDGGHAFDLELHSTDSHLFAATAGGVFRMALNADGTAAGLWDMIDTDVVLDSGTVTPEARSMAFDSNDDLYVTTWGHGAFLATSPTTATAMTQIALRGANVAFVAVNPAGDEVVFGTGAEGLVFMAAGSSSTDVEDESAETEIPSGYVLNQNYPNPFNPVTTISFALPQTGQARLAVYDVLGREVQVLIQGTVQAGQHEVQFDAAGLPTGTYIYRLETDKGSFTKQLVLMK